MTEKITEFSSQPCSPFNRSCEAGMKRVARADTAQAAARRIPFFSDCGSPERVKFIYIILSGEK